jgi:hypothetical protein
MLNMVGRRAPARRCATAVASKIVGAWTAGYAPWSNFDAGRCQTTDSSWNSDIPRPVAVSHASIFQVLGHGQPRHSPLTNRTGFL